VQLLHSRPVALRVPRQLGPPVLKVVGRRGGSTPPPTTGRSSPSPVTSSGWTVTAAHSRDPGRSDRLPGAQAISLFFPVGGKRELMGCTGNRC